MTNNEDLMKQLKEETKPVSVKEIKKDLEMLGTDNNIPAKQQAIHLFLSGKRTKQISDLTGYAPSTIRKWLKDSQSDIMLYQQEEVELVQMGLKALRVKAMDTINKLLDSDFDQVALNAAKDILDRTGFKVESKQNITVTYEQRIQDLANQYVDDSITVDGQVIDDEVVE